MKGKKIKCLGLFGMYIIVFFKYINQNMSSPKYANEYLNVSNQLVTLNIEILNTKINALEIGG